MVEKKILLTGFTPFNDFKRNPSGELAYEFGQIYPSKIEAVVLPVDYFAARKELLNKLEIVKPEICICMGLAKGETFRLETMARKPKEYADIDGQMQYSSLIPANIRQFCQKEDDFVISEDCGQYVCESALWTLLDFCSKNDFPKTAFFLHVPAITVNWPYEKINSVFSIFLDHILSEL